MKRILVVLLAGALALGMVACGAKPTASASEVSSGAVSSAAESSADSKPIEGMPSPMHNYESLEALTKDVGFTPLTIKAESGFTATAFDSISKETSQILLENSAKNQMNLRAAKGAEDISGIQGITYEQKTLPVGAAGDMTVNIGTYKSTEDMYYVAWFTVGDMAYAVSVSGEGMTQEAFEMLLTQLAW